MEKIKSKVITINNNRILYKDEEFDVYDFLKEVKLSKSALFLILGSNIYIKKFDINLKEINEEKINNIKEKEFGKEKEYLIHYEICKKEKVMYMYGILGGNIVTYIAERLNKIKVITLQFYVHKFLQKKVKDERYECIFLYRGLYYYIHVNNLYIDKCHLLNNIEEVRKFIASRRYKDALYVQQGIDLEGDKVHFLNFGGLYNEKIFTQ